MAIRRLVGIGLASAIALLGVGWWVLGNDRIAVDLDPDVIAVMPFRVGGDQVYGYLRESMLDLMSARLTGESGPRVLEVRTTLSAWRRVVEDDAEDLSEDDSRRVAAQLGAGRLMLGNVVATPTDLTLSGSLLDVSDGNLLANGSAAGPPDSLAVLVNRLAAQLLSLEAGEGRDRLEGLAATSLDALQQYLAGQKAYRAGDYVEAIRLWGRAFTLDSNFAQAGFAMVSTNALIGDAVTMAGVFAAPAVWRLREQLNAADRAFLMASPWVGPKFPGISSYSALIDRAETAATNSPSSSDHWMLLGRLLASYGAYAAAPDWSNRAGQALDRAISLDSSFGAAWQARLFTAMLADDLEITRRIAAAYEEQAPHGI